MRRLVGVLCFGYDAFISHARADGRAYAMALWTALEDVGLTACLDQRDFDAGDALAHKLKGTVATSRALILLDTSGARASTYVADEIGTALTKRRRIVPIRSVASEPPSWQHLTPLQSAAIDGLIWVNESAEGFASGAVRVETVAAIRRSLSTWTTRRRLARLSLATAGLVALTAAFATTASFATAKVKALQWTLDDRGTSQRQAVDEVATFLSGPLFPVADVVDRDAADALLNQAVQASIKATRLEVPGDHAFVSPFGGAVVVDRNGAYEVRSPAGSSTCAPNLTSAPAAMGVDDAGTVLAIVTTEQVFAWRLSPGIGAVAECQPMVTGAAWRGPAGDHDQPLGLLVLRNTLAPSTNAQAREVVIWSRSELFRLQLSASGVSTTERFDLRTSEAFGDAQRLFEVRASPGSWIAVLAGPVAAFTPTRLCVVPWNLTTPASCTENFLLRQLALDPSGRYLISGATDRTLRLYDLSLPRPLEQPSRTRILSVRALASGASGEALLALDTDGVLSLMDVPSLITLARRAGFDGREAMLVGDFRRPAYPTRVAITEDSEPAPPFSRTECAGRHGPVIADATGDAGLVVRPGPDASPLPLTDVGVSRQAQVVLAIFAETCEQLVVATTEGPLSELTVVDLLDRPWGEPSLQRRATRAITGTISAVDLRDLAGGWIDATVVVGNDRASQVTERIPVALSTVRSVVRGDANAHHGHVTLWAP